MDAGRSDILSRHQVPRYRLTLDDCHRLGEAGILGEDDRVELLEGQLVAMPPIGPRHALAVDALNESLMTAIAVRAAVRVRNPVVLDGGSEPQPDLTVVRRPWRGYTHLHPQPDNVLPLIEVSDSSLDTDRGAKRELYARRHPRVLAGGPDDRQCHRPPGPERQPLCIRDAGRTIGRASNP
ncbi:MAG TPA: Uma2 family endonuclease [Acetobacteraceae bacterium]|nr:Uma2 family endonuclease [Acetobacteraceae bacterium]